ncbi:MAG TPA: carboxypeptidase-like regulatory domain-containing protein, partial [Panacibacter sp.]|nr:carboxypeptidase-like regulatory domain-containing protein [Panacibacter sp.]
MKPQLQIHVPQPCHEDWNKMTPTDKGKFCGSCNKQVVDFSLMSDQQVLNYFSTATGKTCGRFAEDQLQRELIPTKIEKKKIWWFAALMPLLLFFDKATAQKKNITTPGTPALIKKDPIPQIMGKVAAPVIKDNAILVGEVVENKQCTPLLVDTVLMPVHESFVKDDDRLPINGKILDEQGNIIPFATISIKEPTISFSADGEGFFKTRINNPYRSIAITASSVGYETREVEINAEEANNISITLKQKEIKLPDVIVVSDNFLPGRLGGAVCIVTTITKRDLRATIIRKVFRNEAF